eukprot:10091753-Karenia_brevis.AAC.1
MEVEDADGVEISFAALHDVPASEGITAKLLSQCLGVVHANLLSHVRHSHSQTVSALAASSQTTITRVGEL